MSFVSKDRVKETTATVGTGSITLAGAAANFRTFASVLAISDTCYYAIVSQSGLFWEIGVGTLASATGLARTTVTASSNANALVSLTGASDIFLTAPASGFVQINDTGAIQNYAVSGTGSLVLATSPTLTTPNIGAATGTSLAATGAVSGASVRATNGIIFNNNTITASTTIAAGTNGMSVGPMTLASGVTVTVTSGQRWITI